MKREYYPELIPRRGEWIAWSLTIVSLIAWSVARWRSPDVPKTALIFVLLLLFSASSISLGNWMDRRTVMGLSDEGLTFRNGLRNVDLKWNQIEELRVLTDRWGERVQVLGEDAHFVFRTLGEVTYQGELKGRMGFNEGKKILEQIIISSSLVEKDTAENTRYYART